MVAEMLMSGFGDIRLGVDGGPYRPLRSKAVALSNKPGQKGRALDNK